MGTGDTHITDLTGLAVSGPGRDLWHPHSTAWTLHVKYVERRTKYSILFIFSLFCEYINLEYLRIHVICRVNLAEYAIVFLWLRHKNT